MNVFFICLSAIVYRFGRRFSRARLQLILPLDLEVKLQEKAYSRQQIRLSSKPFNNTSTTIIILEF